MSSDSCLPDAAIVDVGRMGGRRCGGRKGSAPKAAEAPSPLGSRSAETAFSMVPHTSQMDDLGLFSKVHAGHLILRFLLTGAGGGAGGTTICHLTFSLLVTHGLLVANVLLIRINL